jgi:tetratricopeptide (TPR) repeat protein
MSTKLLRGQIKRLADDVELIGDDFEAFGRILMDHFSPIRLTHPGLNELGFPVGYTVDTVDPDGKLVAEYSAKKNYFYKQMPKAQIDLAHALQEEPGAEVIYLLSSNRRKTAPVKAFREWAYRLPQMKGRKLRVWGAVEIASVVRELLFNDLAVDELAGYLPSLRKIRDEEAASLEAPDREGRHVDVRELDKEIEARLRRCRCVVLAGISGSGKSAAAKSFAARRKKSFDTVIWLPGDRVRTIKDLNSVPITRGGDNRNVSFLLRNQRCLLVIDDLQTDIEAKALGALCGQTSRILVTRQKPIDDCYIVPPADEAVARTILNKGAPTPCPAQVFEKIWRTVGGHPMTLALINADIRSRTSWEQIEQDCDAIGEFDSGGIRLADRLLGRIRQLVAKELSVFQWADQPHCDRSFLEEVVKPVGVRKLEDNALTAADRPSVVRLHDIIFSVLAAESLDPGRAGELDNALESYLERVSEQNTAEFWNASSILRPKLEALAAGGDRRPAFLLAMLHTWTAAQFKPSLLLDPATAVARLAGAPETRTPAAIAAIIETIERTYLHDRQRVGVDRAKALLADRISIFDAFLDLKNLDSTEIARIEHHKGKALARTGRRSEAIALFESLLTRPRAIPETKLQLIRLHQRNPGEAEHVATWSRELLDGAAAGLVARSLTLAVMENLPWGDDDWRRLLIAEYGAQIEQTIIAGAESGMPQAYRALASIGRYWARHNPAPLRRVFQAVPPWTLENDLDDEDRGAYAELLMAVSALGDENELSQREEALTFFEAIVRPSPYQRQRHAELLLDMGAHDRAKEQLQNHPELETNPFVMRLMARAELAGDNADRALIWIDRALVGLKVERFRSEFLELRYLILTELDDPAAVDDLRRACAAAALGRERDRLEAELALRVADVQH